MIVGNAKRMLWIDDEAPFPVQIDVDSDSLVVQVVRTLNEAIEALVDGSYDILVLDIVVPGKCVLGSYAIENTIDLVEALRKELLLGRTRKDVPCIFFSVVPPSYSATTLPGWGVNICYMSKFECRIDQVIGQALKLYL